jgi:phage-related protein
VGLGNLLEGRSPYNVVLVDQVLHVDVHNRGPTLILCVSHNRRLPRSAYNLLIWIIPLLGMIGAEFVSYITLWVVLFEILRIGGIFVECFKGGLTLSVLVFVTTIALLFVVRLDWEMLSVVLTVCRNHFLLLDVAVQSLVLNMV